MALLKYRIRVLVIILLSTTTLIVLVSTSTGNISLYTNSYLGLIEPGDQYIHFSADKVFSDVYRRDGYWYLLEPGSPSPWRIKVEADVIIYSLTADTLEAYSSSTSQHVLRVYNPYNPSNTVQAIVNGEDWTSNVSYLDMGNGEYIVELNNISSGNDVQIIIYWTTIPIPEPWILPLIAVAGIILALLVQVKKGS